MRAGACAVQQTLTSEAASVLKHSLGLARRRGHAQVTPLHVAATLLSSRVSLLKRACLKSQPHQSSHPLQCRALELCFNVALNRLPTTPGPLLHGQPSLSNALIAALKRAQAHQRRGCVEQQQHQPLLAIKVELEQLIISILDDPSVSRVMREAGFSSAAVKSNLDDCLVSSVFQCYSSSGGIYSTPSSPPSGSASRELIDSSSLWNSSFFSFASSEQNPLIFPPLNKPPISFTTDGASIKEDIKLVVEVLLRKKRRNAVIVGDSTSITEAFVAELMGKIENGDVPVELRSAHFVRFQFSSAPLKLMRREEVELSISGLKTKVDNLISGGRGVIIYIGDLKWAVEGEDCPKELCDNSPVYHLVAELGRLISCYCSLKVWLMATANYQTYMRSQMMQPNLDVQWSLQAVLVPSNGLGLSLSAARLESMDKHTFNGEEEEQDTLKCCGECALHYEKELSLRSGHQKSYSGYSTSFNSKDFEKVTNELPYCLRPPRASASEKDESVDLKRKWSKLCQTLHKGRDNQNHMIHSLSSQCYLGKNSSFNTHPWRSSYSEIPEARSISFADTSIKPNQNSHSVPRFRRQQSCHMEFNFSHANLKGSEGKEEKITLPLGSSVISGLRNSSSLEGENTARDAAICKMLQEYVPWQSKSIPSIVEVVMDSRSANEDTWILIEGNDNVGKRRLALGIAEAVFGSAELLLDFSMQSRGSSPSCWIEMIKNVLKDRERGVVFVEDIDLADPEILNFLADSCKRNQHGALTANEGKSCQAIFILTRCEGADYTSWWRTLKSVIEMRLIIHETTLNNRGSGALCLDHKRKGDWDCSSNSKSPRNDGMEHVQSGRIENEKGLNRHSSTNTLDLNIKADEEQIGERHDASVVSDHQNHLGFLKLVVKNHFIFDRDFTKDHHMREMFLSKIKCSFENVFGCGRLASFSVEENLLRDICLGSATFPDSLFQKWLKDIFTPSLIGIGKKDGISVRLCLRGSVLSDPKDGFHGSCLPSFVQVSFFG